VEVVGADISGRRLAVAEARQTTHEHRLGKPLKVRFLNQDVFRLLKRERFDVVWTMEAISHIDPAEAFLAAVFDNLGEHGHIIISDSNILNPTMAWRISKMRRRGVETHTHKATSTEEIISYAQERLFTAGQLSRMLRRAGFLSVQVQLSIFFPPSLARVPPLFSICTGIDGTLNKVPVLRNLGGIYTIVASK